MMGGGLRDEVPRGDAVQLRCCRRRRDREPCTFRLTDVDRALATLSFIFQLWNSDSLLVVTDKFVDTVLHS